MVQRRQIIKITAALMLSALMGCSSNTPLTELQPGDTILAFGDSLTYGKGVAAVHSYPTVLQELSGLPVVNAGISGETTAEGLLRLNLELNTHNPSLVILFEGGNDVLQNLPAADTKANLNEMIEQIKAFGADIALVAVPEKSLLSSSAPWYPELAEEHKLPLEDSIVASLLIQPSMKSDSVHFNQAGYHALATAIHNMLLENEAY